jgi:hypothetical protein
LCLPRPPFSIRGLRNPITGLRWTNRELRTPNRALRAARTVLRFIDRVQRGASADGVFDASVLSGKTPDCAREIPWSAPQTGDRDVEIADRDAHAEQYL